MSSLRPATIAVVATLLPVAALGQGVTLPPFERVELENGTVLVLAEKHDVPLVGVHALIRGGAITDPQGLSGIASLLAGMLEKGAGERDAPAFAEAVAAVGGELAAAGEREAITISGDFLARDVDLMVELLADMLIRPILDRAEMQKLRDRSINFIRAAKDSNLHALVPVYGDAFLFGDHPYGPPAFGSETSLQEIQQRELLAYYGEHVGADRLIIAAVGDFDVAAMQEKLTAAFGAWRPAAAALPEVAATAPQPGRRVLLIDKPGATQTYFWLANVGVAIDYPQRAALDLANTLFGGRFTSMLNTELRVNSGLTYGARSILTRPSQPGSVAISSFTKTATTIEAIDMAIDVLSRFRESGIDPELIKSAKNYVLGQYPPKFETASQLAEQLAELELYGLDRNHVDAYADAIAGADGETISSVIGQVFPAPADLVFVLLGDAELIREDISKYGPVTELPITEPRFSVPEAGAD